MKQTILVVLVLMLTGCAVGPNGQVCWQQTLYQGSMYNVSCNPGDRQ
jgi:hypothetical protein